MLKPADHYFFQKDEPVKSCMQFLREHILQQDDHITEAWKYGMPFYCYNGKMFCYLWFHKKFNKPYLGIVEGKSIHRPYLLQEKRSRMKILLLDAGQDLDMAMIDTLLREVLALYR